MDFSSLKKQLPLPQIALTMCPGLMWVAMFIFMTKLPFFSAMYYLALGICCGTAAVAVLAWFAPATLLDWRKKPIRQFLVELHVVNFLVGFQTLVVAMAASYFIPQMFLHEGSVVIILGIGVITSGVIAILKMRTA